MRSAGASFDADIDEASLLKFSPSPLRASTDSAASSSGRSVSRKRDILDAVVNLVNTIIGGGMLALPFALRSCGVVFGSLLLVAFFGLAMYTGRLLVKCGAMGHGATLSQLGEAAFGSPGRVLVEISVLLFSFGALIGYLIIIGDILTPYINLLFVCDRRLVMLFFGALVCLPLSCLRRISLLRFTSLAALVFIAYLVACIVGWSISGMLDGFEPDRVVLGTLNAEFLSVLPIISFAYSFQANVLPVWSEMSEFPATKGINVAMVSSCTVCLIVYLLCAIFGYLSFYELTSDNILVHYPTAAWYFDVGKIGYALIIMFSYPLLCYPMRVTIDGMVNSLYYKEPQRAVSTLRIVVEAVVIFVLAYVIAIVAVGIGIVFGISGATVGNLIVIGLPCILYIVLDVDSREGAAAYPKPWWFYRVFSARKAVPLLVFGLSLVLTVTGLFSIIAYGILGGFGKALGEQ
jgi:amino acid permease